jgi:hypothetical protein
VEQKLSLDDYAYEFPIEWEDFANVYIEKNINPFSAIIVKISKTIAFDDSKS